MPCLTPNEKHNILTLYYNKQHKHTFDSLAKQFNIKGGRRTIINWHKKWNGTVESLERKQGSGRPKVLSSTQVKNYIQIPIRNKNRSHQPVHYTQLLPSVQKKTNTNVSLRSIQRYGKEELGAKQKRTKKRTADESKPAQHLSCI
jgi:transposase